MTELVKALCELSGVSSYEDDVRDFIRERVMAYADEIREDALGNLLIFQRGSRPGGRPIMLCAHMDEVGLIVKCITDEGYLRFGCVGGIDRRVLLGRRVTVGPGRHNGVIGIKAYHLVDKQEEKKVPKVEDMYIDIGASSREEAASLVSLGDVCTFFTVSEDLPGGFLKAKAIDDRFGCACLMRRLTEIRPVCDTWTVFTAQEEVGTRGAFGAAFGIDPRAAIIVEATTAADRPDLPAHKQVCHPGGGAVIPFMDRGAVYSPRLTALARALADKHGILWQHKTFVSGGTDASAVQSVRAGVDVLGIAIAVRYLHSPVSTAAISDFAHAYALLNAVVSALEADGGE